MESSQEIQQTKYELFAIIALHGRDVSKFMYYPLV